MSILSSLPLCQKELIIYLNCNILYIYQILSSYQTAGVCRIHTNIKFGERWNTLKGFIRPALGRRNLDMVTDAHVSKVRHRITKRDNSLSLYSIFVDCRT